MNRFRRYAIYFAPRAGAFADATAAWLGWDCQSGRVLAHPVLDGLPRPIAELTAEPRKYGFHGTIKAPFRLAPDATEAGLTRALASLATRLAPVILPRLALQPVKGFIALLPEGETAPLLALGAEVVAALDAFRAPLTATEIARRKPDRLTQRQRALLDEWGYPYVFEEFRFHLTLTGSLPPPEAETVVRVLRPWLAPVLPVPFAIEDLCLFGEDAEGRFHLVSRHALTG